MEKNRGRKRTRRTAAEIERIVGRFRGSGLTQTEFCRRERIHPSVLGRWLRRCDEKKEPRRSAGSRRTHLARVRVAPGPAGESGNSCPSTAIEIAAPSGHVIRVLPGFDPEVLRQVLIAVGEGC